LPHSQGIRYTPGTFRPKSSLTGLIMCIFFFFGMWMVLILCLARSLQILFVMVCWYGSTRKATPTGFSSFVCGLCFGCRARLISLLLHPFWRKTPFRCWISPRRLSESHSVLARRTKGLFHTRPPWPRHHEFW
jgi:hypothetical protein